MQQRFIVAVILSVVGTAVFSVLFHTLESVSGPGSFFTTDWPMIFCSGGSFLSTLVFARVDSASVFRNLRPTSWITLTTYGFISVGYVIEQIVTGKRVHGECLGVFGHAIFFTGWWVIPGAALTLSAANVMCSTLNRQRGAARSPEYR